jgi:hypothetical protein
LAGLPFAADLADEVFFAARFFLSAFATESASQSSLAPPFDDAGRLLCYSAEPSSAAISSIERLVNTE